MPQASPCKQGLPERQLSPHEISTNGKLGRQSSKMRCQFESVDQRPAHAQGSLRCAAIGRMKIDMELAANALVTHCPSSRTPRKPVRREKSGISSGCESRPANWSLGQNQPSRSEIKRISSTRTYSGTPRNTTDLRFVRRAKNPRDSDLVGRRRFDAPVDCDRSSYRTPAGLALG